MGTIFCSGDFEISHSTFENSRCTNEKCNDSANLYVRFKICFHRYKLVPIKFVLEHSKILHHSSSAKLTARGIRFSIRQPMVTVVLQNVQVNGSSLRGDLGGNILIRIFAFQRNPSKVIFLNCAIENGTNHKGGGVSLVFVGNKHNYTTESNTTLIVFQSTTFRGNIASGSGGALYSTFFEVPFSKGKVCFFNCTILHNYGGTGGALAFTQQQVLTYLPHLEPRLSVSLDNCTISKNGLANHFPVHVSFDYFRKKIQENGDGIVSFHSVKNVRIINSRFVSNNGTALLLKETAVVFEQHNTFHGNWAPYRAAIHICDVSLLFLLNGSTILFINNTASVAGGAIYAGDRCLEATPQCFYQPFIKTANIDQLENMVNLTFINNTAGLAGEAIYGGSVDNCFTYNKFSGSHHNITFSQVYKKIFHVTPYSPSNVTSDPYGICFCKTSVSTLKIDCTNRQQTLQDKFPGEAFNISVVAVGQTYGVVPALIGITSQSTNISMARYQDPPLPKVCQIVSVRVFSKPNSTGTFNVTVKEVNAVKEKSNYYHLKVLNIAVSLKDCPWIFKFNRQTNSCDCSEVLSLTTCNITTLSIHKARNVWIGCSPGNYYDSACSKVEFSSQCLLSRCRDSSNISFTMSNLSDQCVDEREGRLCGRCKSNYSLSLGPMTCVLSEENCSIYTTVLLIVVFILAGVLLVCLFPGCFQLHCSRRHNQWTVVLCQLCAC